MSPGSLSAHAFAAHVRTAKRGFRALLEGPCDVECGSVDGELEMRKRAELEMRKRSGRGTQWLTYECMWSHAV